MQIVAQIIFLLELARLRICEVVVLFNLDILFLDDRNFRLSVFDGLVVDQKILGNGINDTFVIKIRLLMCSIRLSDSLELQAAVIVLWLVV